MRVNQSHYDATVLITPKHRFTRYSQVNHAFKQIGIA
jgi:hypothetical protein